MIGQDLWGRATTAPKPVQWFAALALMLYVAGGPLSGVLSIGPSVGAQPVLLAGALGLGFVLVISFRGGLAFPPETVWIYAWLGFAALSLQWTPDFAGAINLYVYRLYIVLPAALFALNIACNAQAARVYCWSLLVALLVGFVYALQHGLVIGRLTLYEAYNPTWFAGFLAVGVFVATWLFSRHRSLVARLVLLLMIGVFLVGLVLAQARNSLVAVGGALILTGLLRIGRKLIRGRSASPRRILGSAVMLLVLAGSSFFLFERALGALGMSMADLYRVRALGSFGDLELMTAGRNVIWDNGVSLIERPIIGLGFGSFGFEYQRAFDRYTQSHNVYLGTLVELGAIGVLLIVGLWAVLTVHVLRLDREHTVPTAMLFYLMLFSFGNDALGYKHFWVGWLFLHLFLIARQTRFPESRIDART